MGNDDFRSKLRAYVLRELMPGEPPDALVDEAPFAASALVDSLKTLRLVQFVEREAGLEVDGDDLAAGRFGSVAAIVALVAERRRRAKADADGGADLHLAAYLEASAARFPARVAATDDHGGRVTYAELDAAATRVASWLAARGIGRGHRVGLVLPKSVDSLTVVHGILKSGAAYVPVDVNGPAERNRAIVMDCDLSALFVAPAALERLRGAGADLPATLVTVGLAVDGTTPFADVLATAPRALPAAERRRDDVAYVLYTSGSTGVPKGVVLTHENATCFVAWCAEVFTPTEEDRFSSHAPFHFDLSVLDVYLPARCGASVHLVGEKTAQWPKGLVETMVSRKITVWYATPSIFAMMSEFGGLAKADTSALRLALFAGEVFPVRTLRQVVEELPTATFYNLYGPTETNVCTFARIPARVPPDRTKPYPIGHACSHCAARVLGEDGREVPRGEEGRLWIAGPSVFAGYWNRPEASAGVFVEHEGRRWYDTGDVVREVEGEGFVYVGRRDRMVKRRGIRIELGELERALHASPRLREAAVVATSRDDGVRITAFVVWAEGETHRLATLTEHCAAHLATTMVPDAFVPLERLPRTSTDKTDYQALVRLAAEGTR